MDSQSSSHLENYDNEVQNLRTQINLLDGQIVSLLKDRLNLVHQTREIKQIDGIPMHSIDRESVVLKNVTHGADGLTKQYLQEVYQNLLEVTRRVADQKLGPISVD